ncbi:MAG: hypothetical protein IT282_04045 [Bacteroidetes bacterium]|nr:hypothetical protein [Bacteroidota bacterium]
MIRRSMLRAAVHFLISVCLAGPLTAQTASISVAPAMSDVALGQTFDLTVRIDNAYLLHGSSVKVGFDPTLLELVTVSDGTVYPSVQANPIFWWRPEGSLHHDTVLVDQAILGTAIFSGSGVLFTMRFTAVKGGVSAVTLLRVDPRNNQNQIMPHVVSHGQVRIRPLSVNLKAMLQGPYVAGSMATTLHTMGVLPPSHPYAGSPWLHAGTESVTSAPAGIVDWVLVELRTGTAASTKAGTRAAFIRNDGAIVDLDAASPVAFPGLPAGSYYVVLRHRNHLAVMSANPLPLSSSSALYDFTTGPEKVTGGDVKDLGSGVYGLWTGDVNANGVVKYNGSGNDRLAVLTRIGGADVNATVSGYYPEDVNLNGIVKYNGGGNDRLTILQVIGGTNINATRTTAVPE